MVESRRGGIYGAVCTSKTQQGRPADPLLDRGRFRVRAQKSGPHDRKLWRAGGGQAGDGLTAISEFDRTHPDIVLMDITMPQMEGIEAAEKIVQAHPEARVVMVSSVGYQENIVAALQRGARHFVQKPVKPEVLYEVIKYVLGEDGAVATAAGAGV